MMVRLGNLRNAHVLSTVRTLFRALDQKGDVRLRSLLSKLLWLYDTTTGDPGPLAIHLLVMAGADLAEGEMLSPTEDLGLEARVSRRSLMLVPKDGLEALFGFRPKGEDERFEIFAEVSEESGRKLVEHGWRTDPK